MSQPDRTLVSVLAVVVIVTVLGAGCVALSGEDTTESAFEDRLEAADAPETVTATLEVTVEVDGERETITEPVWLSADGTSRVGDLETGSEYVRVDDGEYVRQYDAEADAATVRPSNATDTHYLAFTYAEQKRYAEEYETVSVEETTTDGHDAYHVVFDPPPDETIERSISIAIGDTEYVLPLETTAVDDAVYADRVELETEQDRLFPLSYYVEADGVELTIEYTDVEFDAELDEELFTFEPPESASVEKESSPEYLTDGNGG